MIELMTHEEYGVDRSLMVDSAIKFHCLGKSVREGDGGSVGLVVELRTFQSERWERLER